MSKIDPKIVQGWKNSKLRSISSSLKNFKDCSVKYAYDKQTKIYSVSAIFQGKPYIVTTRIGPNGVEMMLTDKAGNLIEHMAHIGNSVSFKSNQ